MAIPSTNSRVLGWFISLSASAKTANATATTASAKAIRKRFIKRASLGQASSTNLGSEMMRLKGCVGNRNRGLLYDCQESQQIQQFANLSSADATSKSERVQKVLSELSGTGLVWVAGLSTRWPRCEGLSEGLPESSARLLRRSRPLRLQEPQSTHREQRRQW